MSWGRVFLGAELTRAEMSWGRDVLEPSWFGAELTVSPPPHRRTVFGYCDYGEVEQLVMVVQEATFD